MRRAREMGEQAAFLNHVSDAAAEPNGVPLGSGASLHTNFPFFRQEQAINQL